MREDHRGICLDGSDMPVRGVVGLGVQLAEEHLATLNAPGSPPAAGL